MTADVSVLGLGAIGVPIAHAFLAGGLRVTVWNRTSGRVEPLVAAGAVATSHADEAIAAAPLVVLCVSDHDTARALLTHSPKAVADRTLVVLATGTPRQARDLAAWADEHDATYLDGAILAVPHTIGRPEATLLYSGSPAGFTAADPVMTLLGTSRYLGADPARAALFDVAVLDAMYAMYTGFFHAGALVATEHVLAADLTDVLVPWLRSILELLPGFATEIDQGHHPDRTSSIATNAAAVATVREVTRGQGLDSDVLAALHAALTRRVADGHGADGFSGVIAAFHP